MRYPNTIQMGLILVFLPLSSVAQNPGQGNPPIEPPVPVPDTLTVEVDCAAGDTISEALEQPAVELIIEVSGKCIENVVMSRDNVTVKGVTADAEIEGASDDFLGLPHFGNVVLISGADFVTLEDLTISGGARHGVAITGFGFGEGVLVRNCVLRDNAARGLRMFRGRGTAEDTEIRDNGFVFPSGDFDFFIGGGAGIGRYSQFTCRNCTIDETAPLSPEPSGLIDAGEALSVDTYSTANLRNNSIGDSVLKAAVDSL